MTTSATDLANELTELQAQLRTYTQSAGFSFAEFNVAEPGGFVDTYRRRTVEIQNELSRMRVG